MCYVIGYEKRGNFVLNTFLPLFKLSPFQGQKSPRLPTYLAASLGLFISKINVKSYIKPPVLNGELSQ